MPRPPTITPDGVVEAIQDADTPFLSTGDLADHFDVTRQAVRGKRERLAGDPRIKIGKVGNSTVFYLGDSPPEQSVEPPQRTTEPTERPQEVGRPQENQEEADEELSHWKQVPGLVAFVMVFGALIFGWIAFQEAKESIDGLGTAAEVAWQALTGGLFIAMVAIVAQWVLWWSGAGAGPVQGALSYGVGAAALAAIVLGNGGLLGAPANASEAIVSSIWGRST